MCGYTVLALEQSSASTLVASTTVLPEQAVIVIGSEGQGLPPWLMQSGLLDALYELPLRGQTRSLNAHVATALLLWHYSLQHTAALDCA